MSAATPRTRRKTRQHLCVLFLVTAVGLSPRSTAPWTLTGGRLIQALPAAPPLSTPPVAPLSLFDLPALEAWCTQRRLTPLHLKKIYDVLLRRGLAGESVGGESPSTIVDAAQFEERLVELRFARRHARDLMAHFSPSPTAKVLQVQESASGGRKLVVELASGKVVETVLIRHRTSGRSRHTVCVSSQVGCARACSFCATGSLGLLGQLSSAEILEQVFLAREVLSAAPPTADTAEKEAEVADGGLNGRRSVPLSAYAEAPLRNVVFMGMGEPLDNYDAVLDALRGLTHQCLFSFTARRVSVSTVGVSSRRIRRLADDAPMVSLALSLHGATQNLRELLMPQAARAVPIEELAAALDYHSSKTGRGAMLEYLLIDGINDSKDAADALADFCIARAANAGGAEALPYVNLIPYNPTLAGGSFGYQTPSDEAVGVFHERLRGRGVRSFVRWTSVNGRDADGACGQLALSSYDAPPK